MKLYRQILLVSSLLFFSISSVFATSSDEIEFTDEGDNTYFVFNIDSDDFRKGSVKRITLAHDIGTVYFREANDALMPPEHIEPVDDDAGPISIFGGYNARIGFKYKVEIIQESHKKHDTQAHYNLKIEKNVEHVHVRFKAKEQRTPGQQLEAMIDALKLKKEEASLVRSSFIISDYIDHYKEKKSCFSFNCSWF